MPVQPILGVRRVDACLGGKPIALHQRSGDLRGEGRPLVVVEFVRQRHLELPCHGRILPAFSVFRG